jgi:hypothetical protein
MKRAKSVCQTVERVVGSVVKERKHQAEFVRRGMTAIQHTQREGTAYLLSRSWTNWKPN